MKGKNSGCKNCKWFRRKNSPWSHTTQDRCVCPSLGRARYSWFDGESSYHLCPEVQNADCECEYWEAKENKND